MKKCIVISTPEAAFAAIAFRDPLPESMAKVAALGYDAVELAIRDPATAVAAEMAELSKRYNLPVTALGTGQAYGQEGLSLTDPDPAIRARAQRRLEAHIDFARAIGCRQVIIGLIRGTPTDAMPPDEADKLFSAALCDLAAYAQGNAAMATCAGTAADSEDVLLTIEPINRYETSLYNTIAATKALIRRVNCRNVKMLIDTFHMNIEEPDMAAGIIDAANEIAHVHFADSNRWAPGRGHLDFAPLVQALHSINYSGAISAEILPLPTPEESAEVTLTTFKQLGL